MPSTSIQTQAATGHQAKKVMAAASRTKTFLKPETSAFAARQLLPHRTRYAKHTTVCTDRIFRRVRSPEWRA